MQPNVPTVFVVFGATGDLMERKVAPALAWLLEQNQLPQQLQIVAVARRPLTNDEFRDRLRTEIHPHQVVSDEALTAFLERVHYHQGEFDNPNLYQTLADRLGQTDKSWNACSNKLFHLAVPPDHVEPILRRLKDSGLTEPCSDITGWTRILVEKPFGRDLTSSDHLVATLASLFKEEQIYRIDHYLGKEILQHVMNFRFSNHLFEPSWNADHVDRIDVHFLETLTANDRGAFFDGVGALRDVGQNHMLQMLALTTMEAPLALNSEAIRTARSQLFRELKTPTGATIQMDSFRAQYAGYRAATGVDPTSKTETYFKLNLTIDSDRWRGVPIYLEAGKAMGSVHKDIVVTIKHPEPCFCPPGEHYRNTITFQIEPLPSISVRFWAEQPGSTSNLVAKDLVFTLDRSDQHLKFVEGYAQLLGDAIRGDQTSFVSTNELKEMWRVVDPFVEEWQHNVGSLRSYEPGSDDIRAEADTHFKTKGMA